VKDWHWLDHPTRPVRVIAVLMCLMGLSHLMVFRGGWGLLIGGLILLAVTSNCNCK